MKLFDYITISAKHLYKRKLRTSLTVSGICVGIIFLTMMVSLLYGGKQKMDEVLDFSDMMNIIYVSPHIETTEKDQAKEKLREVTGEIQSTHRGIAMADIKTIRDLPNVVAAETFIEPHIKSIRLEGANAYYMARIAGVPVNEYFKNKILAGRDLKHDDINKILLTPMYLDTMNIDDPLDIIGKNIIIEVERNYNRLTKRDEENLEKMRREVEDAHGIFKGKRLSQSEEEEMKLVLDKIHKNIELEVQKRPRETKNYVAEVAGIVLTDNSGEKSRALITQNWAREMLEWGIYNEKINEEDIYQTLIVKADSADNVEKIIDDIEKMGYGADSIKRRINEMKGPVYGISVGLGVLALIALVVASIGVINTMIMAIYERTREIGIMKATGASVKNIKLLFTIEAGVMGFLAGLFGVVIGIGLALLIQYIVEKIVFGGGKVINSALFQDGQVDVVAMPWWGPILIIVVSTLIGMLAGNMPARRAAKMDPAEALRYE